MENNARKERFKTILPKSRPGKINLHEHKKSVGQMALRRK